jgi:hypothetical protein
LRCEQFFSCDRHFSLRCEKDHRERVVQTINPKRST